LQKLSRAAWSSRASQKTSSLNTLSFRYFMSHRGPANSFRRSNTPVRDGYMATSGSKAVDYRLDLIESACAVARLVHPGYWMKLPRLVECTIVLQPLSKIPRQLVKFDIGTYEFGVNGRCNFRHVPRRLSPRPLAMRSDGWKGAGHSITFHLGHSMKAGQHEDRN
jgi:hypothetical protein